MLSTQVLEHVPDPRAYLAEALRVLRPGGRMLLSTHGTFVYHPDPVDLWRWTCEGLRLEVERAGFEVIRFEGIIGPVASGLQLIQDATYYRLPRPLRPVWALLIQSLARLSDRLERQWMRDLNGSVFALVAERPAAMTETIDLACAVERDYVRAQRRDAAVGARSPGRRRAADPLHAPARAARREREALAAMVEREGGRISFVEVADEKVAGFPIEGFTRKATWYRVFLPELVPDADRVLYLDADLIVLDDAGRRSGDTELGDHLVARGHQPAPVGPRRPPGGDRPARRESSTSTPA